MIHLEWAQLSEDQGSKLKYNILNVKTKAWYLYNQTILFIELKNVNLYKEIPRHFIHSMISWTFYPRWNGEGNLVIHEFVLKLT